MTDEDEVTRLRAIVTELCDELADVSREIDTYVADARPEMYTHHGVRGLEKLRGLQARAQALARVGRRATLGATSSTQ